MNSWYRCFAKQKLSEIGKERSYSSNHGTHKSDEVVPLMVRMMVKFFGVSKRIVHAMCRKQGPMLYLDSNFKRNCALNFVDKLRDVMGLYSNTSESMATFSFNENACFQALDSTLGITLV